VMPSAAATARPRSSPIRIASRLARGRRKLSRV
jgi:hypothetical protein